MHANVKQSLISYDNKASILLAKLGIDKLVFRSIQNETMHLQHTYCL